MQKAYEMDMVNGPLLGKIIRFVIPLMLSGMLQLLFNAADMIVVGRFTGSGALAAVGATTFLIGLQVNLFIGISVGANVMTARYFGSKNEKDMSETVHTAILLALIAGCAMIVVGNLVARPVLQWMDTPEDVISDAVLYIRIYFVGMPALMLYNFGAAILRAVGDTKRPLYFLSAAGIVNVIFNLLFVIVFHMGVAGVAIATVISQLISAVLVIYCLCRSDGTYRLELRKLHIYRDKLISILKVGLSAGFQSVLFNIANIMIQSSVNSFGSLVMAGNTAASNIESFVYVSVSSTSQTAITFISQNMGAGKYRRVKKVFGECLLFVAVVASALGISAYLFGGQILKLYSSDEQVIAYGVTRMAIVCVSYGLNGMQDVMASSFRGMGATVMPTAVSLVGICLTRIIWLMTVFKLYPTRVGLYLIYPFSWIVTVMMHTVCWMILKKKRLDPLIKRTEAK